MPKVTFIEQNDWSGGVNAVSNPHKITEKQVFRIRNLILDEHGSLRTRDGYALITTSPDLVNPIFYRAVLNNNAGTSFPYAIQGDGVNPPTLWRTDLTPWENETASGGFNNAFAIPQSITVNNLDVIANGYEVPKTYTGAPGLIPITAAGGQQVPAGAQHIAFHLGSVWVWNTSIATSALDGPSSIRMSDPNNPNSWPNANQTFIAKDDGQTGTGLATFTIAETGISPTQTLVVFKNYSGYQIIGVFGSSNFSIQKIKSDMGCVAPRSIQFVSGFGIIRLTHKGFALFDGVDDKLISEEIRPYIFGRDDLSGINYGNVGISWASQSQNPPLYICGCSVSSPQLSRFFIYDLVRKAWTICDYPINLQSLGLISTPTIVPTVQAGSSTGGQIIRLFSGDVTDGGAAVNWQFTTKDFFTRSSVELTYWRRAILEMAVLQNTTVNFQWKLTGPSTTVSAIRTFNLTGQNSIWGNPGTTWGTFIWGGAPTDTRQDVDILAKSSSIQFQISGTGPVRIRTFQLQNVSMPLTKAIP